MSTMPTISLASIGCLSDVLREMPLVTPTDYYIENETAHQLSSLSLFDNQQQLDKATQLINTTDPYLVELLNNTLSQIDTSKIQMKNDLRKNTTSQAPHIPPILQSALAFNQNLFNGALNEHYARLNPQRNSGFSHQQQQKQQQKQQYQGPSSSILSAATTSLAVSSQNLVESPKPTVQSTQSFYSKPQPQKQEPNKFYSKPEQNLPQQKSNVDMQKQKQVNRQKNQLATWQANVQSQLLLPQDFTPELIAQLAAEGYDVTSGASRKARSRQQSTLASSVNAIEDSSDEENEDEFGRITGKSSKPQPASSTDVSRLTKGAVKYNGEDPNDNPSFKRFSQILDDLIDSYEEDLHQITKNRVDSGLNDNEEESEIPNEYLLSKHVCADMVQEAFKLNSLSIMHLVRRDNLNKLQNLIYFNIKDGLKTISFLGDAEQDKMLRDILIDKLLRAADCSILSLIIMTANQVSKELVSEDLIEQVAAFVKVHLTETIFPYYDSVYKSSTSGDTAGSNKTAKRKLVGQFNTSAAGSSLLNNKTKQMQHFYNRMREIMALLADLVVQIDLTDTIIITLSSLSVLCFFVENINDLQLEALKLLTSLFSRYSKHRQLVLDDILNSLIKLPAGKRTSRPYKCLNGDSIQMFSALVLQLIQCEVTTIDHFQASVADIATTITDLTFEEKESFLINAFEDSATTAKKFLSIFYGKCKTKQADSDFRPIFENFIQDLLITVNKPEWPVSETILNLLGIILVSQVQSDQNDAYTRVNSLEYLGQIVSQLRKDSLEYQKYPDKVLMVLSKVSPGLAIDKSLDSCHPGDDDLFELQKTLLIYLRGLSQNDVALRFSQYFLAGQWIKELNQAPSDTSIEHDQERIEAHTLAEQNRKRLYALVEKEVSKSADLATSCSIDFNEAFILAKYLSSLKRTLDKNFDYYLVNILSLSGGSSNEANTPTQVRSKAIKCLSLIIEADPQILLKQKVFQCVEANFLHQTISVREASVDLIGRFITIKPELTTHYYKLLSDRILDVGVSVRKRVIKIFRDVCVNQPDFEHLSEICVKILRRICDEDAIKKLVIDTFYSLWFAPIRSEHLRRRVLSIVDVVSEFPLIATNTQSQELFEQLFNSLIVTEPNKDASISATMNNMNESVVLAVTPTNEQEMQLVKAKETLKSCKQIVDCLIENVLNTEANTSSSLAYKRLVASFSTLYLLSKIKPENFINHAETLLPYLNIKSTNQNDNQIINSAAKILECVVPLLQSPSNSFLLSLEESLCKLIFQGGMMIVSSCISCLGTVVNKLTKNYKLASDCFSKFYKNADYIKKTVNKAKPLEPATKTMIFRMLFTLGLLSKHFEIEGEEFNEYKLCTKEELFSLFIFFIKGFEVEVQHKALIGLGSFLSRYSDFMMKDEVKTLYHAYIKNTNVPITLKSQIFINLTDYLNEEDKRNLVNSVELTKSHCKDDLKEMLDVQSGMASTIIQSYLKPILDSYLTSNAGLRINVFNCLSMILNQGLVYPIECVPYLIAMTTDPEKKVQSKSLVHLTNLQKAHPSFVQSKSIAGVSISFMIQKIIKKSLQHPVKNEFSNEASLESAVRGYSCTEQGELLSLNHHLYSLLRTNRSYRRAFLQQLVKMFDDSVLHSHATLSHKLFICDNLAFFPYQLMDEPLYLINQIDIIISISGINLLQTFKEHLLNHVIEASNMKNDVKKEVAGDADGLDAMCLDMTCPDEAEEKPSGDEVKKEHFESPVASSGSSKKIIDDDEETFDTVLENMPENLQPLKECIHKAQGCCLLLILKFFLKEVYSLSESKIQNYNPTDTAKVNDRPIMSRKLNRKFNPKQIIEYMLRSNIVDESEEELKRSLVREYLEFKELILSIDQEEAKSDDKTPASGSKTAIEPSKISAIQQKLLDGIEKTKVPTGNSGVDSNTSTPRKSNNVNRRKGNSSCKKSAQKKKKRRRENENNSDMSSDDSEQYGSDMDEEM